MGLVDDQRVVAGQQSVPLDLGQEDPVGHDLDQRAVADPIGEAHGVTDRTPERDVELLGEALGDRAGRDAPRLGVSDQAAPAPTELQADLRDLGRLPRTRLARHDHHLVVADGRQDLRPVQGDRQVVGIADGGNARPPSLQPPLRLLEPSHDPRESGVEPVRADQRARRIDAPLQVRLVAHHHGVYALLQFVE